MTYDFGNLINAALASGQYDEGSTEEVQETQEYEEPMSNPVRTDPKPPVQVNRDNRGTEVRVSFPPFPVEMGYQPIQMNCYVDASVHIEQKTINNTSHRNETVIGVGDTVMKSIMGAVGGIAGLLKG